MKKYFYSILRCGEDIPSNKVIDAKNDLDATRQIYFDYIGCENEEEYKEDWGDGDVYPFFKDLTIDHMLNEMLSNEDILTVIVDCQKGEIIFEQ